MKLSTILNVAAGYLQTDSSAFLVNGEHLGLVALNQARNLALMKHNFEFTRKQAEITVGTSGADLSNMVLFGTATPVAAQTIQEVCLVGDDGVLLPIEWTLAGESFERLRGAVPNTVSRVVFGADRVSVYPAQTEPVRLYLEIFELPSEWAEADLNTEPAIWSRQGQPYLLWQTVIQLNYLRREFVFRQEGNLQPPEKLVEEAFETFRQWDIQRYEQFRRHYGEQ